MNKAGIRIHLDYAKAMGITGNGIGAAVMDTGIAPHPDFEANGKRLAAFYDVVNRKDFFYDDSGHGTHVSGC